MAEKRRLRMCFVVESGTDVRMIEEFSQRYGLTVLVRRIRNGVAVSHSPEGIAKVVEYPPSRLLFGWHVFRRLFFAREFDVVVVQGYLLAALAANVASFLTRTSTYMLVCSPIEAYHACRRKRTLPGSLSHVAQSLLICFLADLNARLGRHYIVLSQYLARVVRVHGTRASIDVVPVYGVDTNAFRPSVVNKETLRETNDLPLTGPIIVYNSRFAPEKDSATLLGAFSRLLQSGQSAWLLHRSGGYRQFIEQAARRGVAERVIATDARHPLKQLAVDYQAADLCVQASKEEGLGFSPLEALACGMPVVAASVGGLTETIIDGVTGWTYEVGDEDGLFRCLAAALHDPAEAQRRAAAGRKLVLERYTSNKAFDQFDLIIKAAQLPS